MLSFATRALRPSVSVFTILSRLLALCGLLFVGLSASAATTPPPPVITFTDLDLARTYTGLPQEPVGWTISPGTPDDYTVVKITYNGKTALPKGAGAYTVKVTVTEKAPVPPLTKPRTVSASGKFTVAKAPLTVIAQPAGRLFGAANPPLTLTYEGFLNGETFAVLAKKPVARTTAKSSSPVGTYPITVVGGSDTDYEITTRTPADLTVVAFASGTHEALLTSNFGEGPIGKVEITLPTKGATFTGKLNVDSETTLYPFKGVLGLSSDYFSATGVATIKRPATRTAPAYQYLVTVTIDAINGLAIEIERTGDEPQIYTLGDNAKIKVHVAKTNPAPWAGSHTFALLDPTPSPINLFFDNPEGIGYATAGIGTNGNLTLRGKLADGSPLTATLYSSVTGSYLAYIRPYGTRLHSDLAGSFQLIPHPTLPDRYYVPRLGGDAPNTLYWRKAEKITAPLDKNYPDGFDEIYLSAALDPWIPPYKGKAATKTVPAVDPITLAQLLGIADTHDVSADFRIDYGTAYFGDWDDLGYIPYAFYSLTLTTKNLVRLPAYMDPNVAKWKMTVNASNGLFSGSFSLKDEVWVLGADKIVPRTVRFQGILRQHSEADADHPFGAGYLLLDALPDSDGERSPPISYPVFLSPATSIGSF